MALCPIHGYSYICSIIGTKSTGSCNCLLRKLGLKNGKRMRKSAVSISVLTLSALYSMTALLVGPQFACGHGSAEHINWASQVSAAMREGVLYPRWMSLSNGGYGSPATIFYPPLFYFLTGIVNLFVPSLAYSLKITTFSGFLLSGLGMYIFLRNFCGHKASVVGGIAYQILPYHLLDLYVRVTLAETFAFAWLPLILHFSYKGSTEDAPSHWIGLAFSYAGLVLTHLASAYIFTFAIAAFALFLSLKGKILRLLLKLALSNLLGLLISSVYFIPMFFERKYVHIEWITEVAGGDYRHNFLFMKENRGDPFHTNLELIFILHSVLALLSLILYYNRRESNNTTARTHFTFFFWLSVFSFFILTPFSTMLWGYVPGLPTIQFPWRWLMVSTLSVSILIGFVFDASSLSDIKKDRFARISMALFHAILIASLYLSSFYMLTSKQLTDRDLEWILRYGGDVVEYRPIWITRKNGVLTPAPIDACKNTDIWTPQKNRDFIMEKTEPVVLKEGIGVAEIVSWKSHSRLFKVMAVTPSILRISTFYYPGWTALVNGRELPIGIEKDSGAMLLNIPSGKNEVLLEFRDTPLRRVAKWISVVSLLAAFIGLIAAKRNRMALF